MTILAGQLKSLRRPYSRPLLPLEDLQTLPKSSDDRFEPYSPSVQPNVKVRFRRIVLNNLARVALSQNRFDDAEELYRLAIEISEQTLGRDHPDYAIHLGNLGQVLSSQGKDAEAKSPLLEAMRIFEAALPADHVYIQETQRRLNDLP